uniref:DET1- and DDB1-associated protein 1 domain-containing protein n=1 Tax=Gossypium raimondii TaxID=29730 RepID=A0A0D2ML57_GOSRA|nr:hypothetical protein B456_003G085700 [Gossypium raimondii]KJB19128.1 hypothetical protein B456_003G085700 [Gossypium raimondii]
MMGSMLGDLPSFDPHNFSQLRPSDPSNPSKVVPTTYRPTHSRTSPPPDQGIEQIFSFSFFSLRKQYSILS